MGAANDSRRPTYCVLPNAENISFQNAVNEIVGSADANAQVKFLNKAALEWCVGGGLYPGIEMTYLAYDKKTFRKREGENTELDFRYGRLQTSYTYFSYL